MTNWVIYKIVSPSGRVYIGLTSNFKKRMNYYKNHGKSVLRQRLLASSFLKYGFESHSVSVIEEFVSDINYAHEKEIFWIRSFMSNNIKWPLIRGMNLTDGGQGTLGFRASDELKKKLSDAHKGKPSSRKGKKLPEETKAKIRAKLREYNTINKPKCGRKLTDDHRAAISAANKGKPKYKNRGRVASAETKKKQSEAKLGKEPWNKGKVGVQKAWNKGTKGIMVSWNKGKDYSFLSVQERKDKFGKHNIGSKVNLGRVHSEEHRKRMSEIMTGMPNTALYKPVVRYNKRGEILHVYNSVKEASEKTVFSGWTISNIASGKAKLNTYLFKYKRK